MKLLFDQNLSFKLCARLADLFPHSNQVRLAGLETADDRAVWEFARSNGFTIVSQDSDFADMAAVFGAAARKSSGCAAAIKATSSSRNCFAITPRLLSPLKMMRMQLVGKFIKHRRRIVYWKPERYLTGRKNLRRARVFCYAHQTLPAESWDYFYNEHRCRAA